MKKATVYTGLWYIPESDKRCSGVLKISEKKKSITLTIYSPCYIDGTVVDVRNLRERVENPIIILGEHKHPITLYNCRWSGTSTISDEISKITYEIDFVFEFAHFTKAEDIVVKTSNIKFPYFTSFYDSWQSVMGREDEIDVETLEVININSIFNIGFNNVVLRNNELKDKYRKYVNFIYLQKIDFNNALRNWAEFASMLKLATAKDIRYEINWIVVDKNLTTRSSRVFSNNITSNEIRCRVKNFSLGMHRNETDKGEWIHQNSMIFSAWKLSKDIINDLIKKWYNNRSLYPIYDYYIDSNSWPKINEFRLSNVMFNNKFLNLMQGLEAYHFQLNEAYNPNNQEFVAKRQRVLNSVDSGLRDWVNTNLKFPREYKLNDRLHLLLSRFDIPLKNLLGDLKYINYFPTEAKDMRHRLSHGNLDSTYQGEQLHHLLHIAQVLLCMCILESLGLEKHDIVRSLESNTQMERIAYEAVHHYRLKETNG
jgi:hypothetical protein